MAVVVKRKEYVRINSIEETQFHKTWGRSGVKCVHDPVRVTLHDGSQFLGTVHCMYSNGLLGVMTPSGNLKANICPKTDHVEIITGGVCDGDN
jgi:hypothetical protein